MTGRYCFHRCLSVNILTFQGGGYPIQVWMVGGTPSQVWPGGGYPIPGLAQGTPLDLRWGTPPDMGWGPPQTSDRVPPRHGMGYPLTWDGVPPRTGMGYPPRHGTGYPQIWDRYPPRTWDRVPPPPGPEMGYPQTDQHSEHLLHGGRYASCVHAGGLSCIQNCLHHMRHFQNQ